MGPRTGRPRTGETPNISIRLDREAYKQARVAAVIAGQTLGEWLAAAIREKLQRERGGRHVTTGNR
jgi:predicted HicB family RNase H-like nuclease